ncbi:MAG: hypothetical protein HC903_26780 [Methylacidiphilales bacterium]|nr:hypothetical protein [Candidatus Methylacidiphilales bacterium]
MLRAKLFAGKQFELTVGWWWWWIANNSSWRVSPGLLNKSSWFGSTDTYPRNAHPR